MPKTLLYKYFIGSHDMCEVLGGALKTLGYIHEPEVFAKIVDFFNLSSIRIGK